MKSKAVIGVLIVAVSALSTGRAAAQASHTMSAEDHRMMAGHGANTMGFSQTETTHHFFAEERRRSDPRAAA
jgi:hypothetical protein